MDSISVDEGLPDSTVYSIAMDKSGFLWFGMPTALARYDGYGFRNFIGAGADNPLTVSNAGNIFIDSQQRLWIGTWGEGLALYDRNMQLIEHFTYSRNDPNSIGSNMIQTIYEDHQGDIWIGTNGGGLGLYRQDTRSFVNYKNDVNDPQSISHDRVWSITETGQGIMWIGTSDGLNRVDKKQAGVFSRFNHETNNSNSINHVLVRTLLGSGPSRVWVGTELGFGYFNTQTEEFTEIPLLQGGISVNRIIEDNQGGVWIGSQSGLFRYQMESGQLDNMAKGDNIQLFPHSDIRDLVIDESGVLWVATRYSGLRRINLVANQFTFYSHFDNSRHGYLEDSINKVTSLFVDKSNTLWIGASQGLMRLAAQDTQVTRIPTPSHISSKNINSIAQDKNGLLWLGGPFGLLSYNSVSSTFRQANDILGDSKIRQVSSIHIDGKGAMWIGMAHEGLIKVIDGQRTVYQHRSDDGNSISSDAIGMIYEDRQGRIWIATEAGVNRYDADSNNFLAYSADKRQSDTLSDNIVHSIYQSSDGLMWFGTIKSLDQLDESSGEFTHYGVADGLDNSNIKSIIEDKTGNLWVGTDRGLSQFKRKDNYFFNFSEQDSLQSNDLVIGAVAQSHNEIIYFGDNHGVHEILPSEVKINEHIPHVLITDVWIDDQAAKRLVFDKAEPLVLSHEVSSIRLRFAALDFQAPDKNRYACKLEGVDKVWRELGEERNVTYTNLAPGTYTFAVTGSNNSNQWNSQSSDLIIIITEPWWSLWWAKIVITLGVILIIYMWYRYRLITQAGQRQLIEVEVELRTDELNQQHDELLTTLQKLNRRSKILESENKELTESLHRLREEQQTEIEKEKMAAFTSMVVGISEEINTPIGVGITTTTLMEDKLEILKQAFDESKLSAKQLGRYISDTEQSLTLTHRNLAKSAEMIRSFKQVSVAQPSEEKTTIDMPGLINEVLLILKPKLDPVIHKVRVNCPDNLRVISKAQTISQIINNLILNSLAYGFIGVDRGLMSINVSLQGNIIEILYQDNGNGMSDEMAKHIFEPFVSGKRNGLEKTASAGLGMHLAFKLATQGLEGSIRINRQVERGVEFKVIFPVELIEVRDPLQEAYDSFIG